MIHLDRQVAACRELVAQHSTWVIEGEFLDRGSSPRLLPRSTGQLDEPRTAFEQMAASIEAGEIDIVVAYSADRLSRRPRESSRLSDGAATFMTRLVVDRTSS